MEEEKKMPLVEKRQSPRNTLIRKVSVSIHHKPFDRLLAPGPDESCWSQDISRGGIRLETKKGYRADAVLKLNFQFIDKKNVDVVAKVVWSRENRCGLKFMAFDAPSTSNLARERPASLSFSRRIGP